MRRSEGALHHMGSHIHGPCLASTQGFNCTNQLIAISLSNKWWWGAYVWQHFWLKNGLGHKPFSNNIFQNRSESSYNCPFIRKITTEAKERAAKQIPQNNTSNYVHTHDWVINGISQAVSTNSATTRRQGSVAIRLYGFFICWCVPLQKHLASQAVLCKATALKTDVDRNVSHRLCVISPAIVFLGRRNGVKSVINNSLNLEGRQSWFSALCKKKK